MRQQEGTPEPLNQLNPEVPPALARAVTTSLAPDPEHRYRSAAEMREAVRTGMAGRDSTATTALATAATRTPPPRRRSHPRRSTTRPRRA